MSHHLVLSAIDVTNASDDPSVRIALYSLFGTLATAVISGMVAIALAFMRREGQKQHKKVSDDARDAKDLAAAAVRAATASAATVMTHTIDELSRYKRIDQRLDTIATIMVNIVSGQEVPEHVIAMARSQMSTAQVEVSDDLFPPDAGF